MAGKMSLNKQESKQQEMPCLTGFYEYGLCVAGEK
jgi:hypothetical protein